ncbi:MAG TPA: SRPBCC family protein [Actinocrinis sp.]|nr:SRPBCC family protein [Actinocrinis sp.]
MATKALEGATRATAVAEPGDQLRQSVQHLVDALAQRAVSNLTDKVGGTVGKLGDVASGSSNGGSVLGSVGAKALKAAPSAVLSAGVESTKSKLKDAGGGVLDALKSGAKSAGKNKGGHAKITNIVESIEVGAPIDVVYDQWTRFSDFPSFMKKVERVEQVSEEKLAWKAQVFWSHRTWESTIREQVPDERIVWRSKGDKGYVDGAVTFHELAPDLTKVIVVLEYHPQGLFERTGNMWRAQGRRVRLELKHFQRHVMTNTLLHPDDVDGWRGEIHDGKVVSRPGDDEREQDEGPDDEQYEDDDEYQDQYEDEDDEDDEEYEQDEEEDEEERS